jgi:hypothetical protein
VGWPSRGDDVRPQRGLAADRAWAIENIGPLLFALLLLVLYQARPGSRRLVLITILVWGLLNAIVGGVLAVLPLPIWPFEPEQSISTTRRTSSIRSACR